jgi:hypothetical protein
VAGTEPSACKQGMTHKSLTAHAIGMSDRNRATIHIQFVIWDAQAVPTVNHLDGKGLVQFPKINVVYGKTGAL